MRPSICSSYAHMFTCAKIQTVTFDLTFIIYFGLILSHFVFKKVVTLKQTS